jgi:NDP-sugar pyrophosphorylase family protein
VPIIDIVLRQLAWHGVREVAISVGYLGELIEAYLATRGGIKGLSISYIRESSPLGTAGPLGLLAQPYEDTIVVNGDILTDFDFASMIAFHREQQPALTIAVHHREVMVDLGVVDFEESGRVVGFREKPRLEYHCSMGVNIYSAKALELISPGQQIDFPDVALKLVERGDRVQAFPTNCYWMDIGRRDDYDRAIEEFPGLRDRLLPDESEGDGIGPE